MTEIDKCVATPESLKWIYRNLRHPFCGNVIWSLASSFTIGSVGLFSKLVICILNNTCCHNVNSFEKIIETKRKDVPLVTVSNHRSCFDDPGLWGCLKVQILCKSSKMRWSLAAQEICFTKNSHSYFFMLGRCIPIFRGQGVYQEAINFCIERLERGDWLHIFSEGKVNTSNIILRLKWGVGRVVYDCPVTPIVIPIWHIGMDEILPNTTPYRIHTGKRLTINFGNPIDLSVVSELKRKATCETNARKLITDKIQEELLILKSATEELHKKSSWKQCA